MLICLFLLVKILLIGYLMGKLLNQSTKFEPNYFMDHSDLNVNKNERYLFIKRIKKSNHISTKIYNKVQRHINSMFIV